MGDVVAGLAVFGVVIAVGWLLVRTRAVPADDCTEVEQAKIRAALFSRW